MSRFFTWRDVEAALRAIPDPPWLDALVSPHAVEILLSEVSEEAAARRVLVQGLGVSFHDGVIELVAAPGASRRLSAQFFVADEEDRRRLERVRAIPPRPLWGELPSAVAQPIDTVAREIAVFFSYKGGVGRTTVALAVLGELLRRQSDDKPRVLLVDADVEAPGLSWLLPREGRPSLVDILGLLHDAEDWRAEALPLIAGLVRSSREAIEFPERGRREFFFVPAVREIDQVFRLPLTPEHLLRGRGRARIICDFFTALAEVLDLDAILIDARAGITEFSSPLLLDARTRAVLVTSCNRQAVEGTVETLRHLRASRRDLQADSVVLTFVPPDRFERVVEETQERIFVAMDAAGEEAADEDVVRDLDRFPLVVPFAQELLHDASVAEFLVSRIPGTQLGKSVAPALAELLVPRARALIAPIVQGPPTYGEVHEMARQLEFAESNATRGLLPIPALRSLVEPPPRLPSAVVLGAKGAGKTFAWGQMVLSKTWEAFVREIAGVTPPSEPEAFVFPLLHPKNIDPTLSLHVQAAEERAQQGRKARLSSLELARQIEDGRSKDVALQFWLDAIVERLGLPDKKIESVRALEAAVRGQGQRIVLVLDGIEDALQLAPQERLSEPRRRLLRLLLQDLTMSIRDLGSEHIGIVTFIRRDYATEALAQNFRQFENLHRHHALQWSPTEALRLPLWLCRRLGWDLLAGRAIESASLEELKRALIPFWGERMGKNKREPFCDEWIIAALSDLNGRIQARDLVRLIRFATERDPALREWPISPRRLRAALKPCAEFKVEELEKEIRTLKPILDKLRAVTPDRKAIPFIPRKLAIAPKKRLEEGEVRFLEDQGLITKLDSESAEYYMPEVIRQGLGYKLTGGRRAKVLSLYRAALSRAQT